MFSNILRKSCRLCDKGEKQCTAVHATDDNMVWCMHIACSVPKATNTHSDYVTRIAFPLQQRLHELASMLRYRCKVCLVIRNLPLGQRSTELYYCYYQCHSTNYITDFDVLRTTTYVQNCFIVFF